MNAPPSSETPVGRLTQRGDTLAKQIQASLREYHLIEHELRSRYPNIVWQVAVLCRSGLTQDLRTERLTP